LPDRVFRQEILAEFIENEGTVFRGVFEVVEAQHCQPELPIRGKRYVMGCDLARVQDFTVVAVLDESGRQVHHERFNQISWERQTATIDRIARSYDARVYLDSTGVGDPIYERLRKAGLDIVPYGFTNASKEALIDNLAMKIEAKQVTLMDIPAQTNELLAYQYELTPSRNVRMNAPQGMHDDCVIALALAACGLAKPRPAYRLYSLT
jgi:phage FluMu gp28-like protein